LYTAIWPCSVALTLNCFFCTLGSAPWYCV